MYRIGADFGSFIFLTSSELSGARVFLFLLNKKRYTFALTLRLGGDSDNFLRKLDEYTKKDQGIIPSPDYTPYLGKNNKWWTDYKLISDLQRKSSSFRGFYDLEIEKEDKQLESDIQFVVRETKLDKGN